MTDDQFRELVTLYLEDAIGADGLEQLNRALANSQERTREFNDLRLLTGALPEIMREAEAVPPTKTIRFPHPLRWIAAAAACLVIGLTIWLQQPQEAAPGKLPRQVASLATTELAPGWVCESRGATFTVVAPGRVRLEQGELFVKSVAMEPGQDERAPLSIETDAGVATAKGTEFFIGSHDKQRGEEMNALKATRVLVLSGIVTLTNQFGAVAGEANDLLVADPDSAPVKETVKANSQFAVDLYKQVSRENEGKNIFFSPYSISSALAMAAEGARGETADEMAEVLHFPAAAKRVGESAQLIPWRSSLIHTGFEQLNSVLDRAANDPTVTEKRKRLEELKAKLAEAKVATQKAKEWQARNALLEVEQKLAGEINELAAQIDPFELNIANAIWAEKTFSIEAPYRETVGKHYGTGAFRAADFKGNADGEREKINSWVEGKTKDRIKDLIGKGVLTEYTRMVLVNAIYFKGEWASPFKEANTKDADFTTADGTKTTTPTMHGGSGDASYAAFDADGTSLRHAGQGPHLGAMTPGPPGIQACRWLRHGKAAV